MADPVSGQHRPDTAVAGMKMDKFILGLRPGVPPTLGSFLKIDRIDPFLDVDSGAWSCPHIKRLGELNITGGCGNSNYCPQGLVTREQMREAVAASVPPGTEDLNQAAFDSGFEYAAGKNRPGEVAR